MKLRASATAPLFLCLIFGCLTERCAAQTDELPAGFHTVAGKYIDVVTDLPLTDELRELPAVFDAAMPQWCEVFGMQMEEVGDWHGQVFIMLERERFRAAGLIPENIPNFPYGFQYGNQMWVTEQPSPYYRRHLMLHEGTHWFMNRKYGQYGPPWLMEGMAEWLGTHRWNATTGKLTMGIVPATRDEVPYWGRIALIQEQLTDGFAPSLESILRYDSSAHQQVDAYAWSWAAVIFLRNHEQTRDAFARLLKRPMSSDERLTRWLFGQLRSDWPRVRAAWQATLTEMEYGYDPSRGMLSISSRPLLLTASSVEVTVQADQSWQASGFYVRAGTKVEIASNGMFTVGQTPEPWRSTPDGVTLEYYRGHPLGQLMLTIGVPLVQEPQNSQPITTLPIGAKRTVVADATGELHFRVNETSAGLRDNAGELSIKLSPIP